VIIRVKWKGGMNNWRLSTNRSLYFENGTRYGHSYNGRRIRTRKRSIECYHFQWLWTTLSDLKNVLFISKQWSRCCLRP